MIYLDVKINGTILMSRQSPEPEHDCDRVEARRRQWNSELPDVDTSGMAVLGRARLITAAVRSEIETDAPQAAARRLPGVVARAAGDIEEGRGLDPGMLAAG